MFNQNSYLFLVSIMFLCSLLSSDSVLAQSTEENIEISQEEMLNSSIIEIINSACETIHSEESISVAAELMGQVISNSHPDSNIPIGSRGNIKINLSDNNFPHARISYVQGNETLLNNTIFPDIRSIYIATENGVLLPLDFLPLIEHFGGEYGELIDISHYYTYMPYFHANNTCTVFFPNQRLAANQEELTVLFFVVTPLKLELPVSQTGMPVLSENPWSWLE